MRLSAGRMRSVTGYRTSALAPTYQNRAPAGHTKFGILDPDRAVSRLGRLNGLTV
jgi:hypothetical protein